MSHSNDDIEILNKTVLKKIIEGLWIISDGGRFIVTLDEVGQLQLSFDGNSVSDGVAKFNVPIHLFINGDLKYFAQMLGRDGMSTCWCMYCKAHPNEWKGLLSVPEIELWSIAQQMQHLWRIDAGEVKEARVKKGIVALPLIDFIEPNKYIFLQLHFEIGTVNNVLDALRGFIEEEVEVLSDAKKEARNAKIISDVRYTKAKDKAEAFNSTGGAIELRLFRIERCRLNQGLKDRNLAEDRKNSLLEQRTFIGAKETKSRCIRQAKIIYGSSKSIEGANCKENKTG